MAKSNDILDNIQENLEELNQKIAQLTTHQLSMIENYDMLMQNQLRATDNHDIVVQNQKTIIKNQGIITHNQSSIIHNQAVIVKNQAFLRTIMYAQVEILTHLTQRPKEEISQEIEQFFDKAQKDVAMGFEQAMGE
jgi:hypothetical protein